MQEKVLVAYIVPMQGPLTAETTAEIRQHTQSKLPIYMVPAHFMGIDALPLSPNGKLNRQALPMPEAIHLHAQNMVMPQTPTEIYLVQIWQNVLGIGAVSVEDDFFSLGGHSLLATQLVARIAENMDITITLRQLFEAPTIANLAYIIDHANGTPTSSQPGAAIPLVRLVRQPLHPSDSEQRAGSENA